jgi:hypothetical protein
MKLSWWLSVDRQRTPYAGISGVLAGGQRCPLGLSYTIEFVALADIARFSVFAEGIVAGRL